MGISDLVRFTPIWSDLVIRVTRAPPRALRSSDTPMLVVPRIHTKLTRRGPSRFFCCCSIHLELYTCWDSTVRKHSHFQTPLENPSIQTHLVLLCCSKCLCILGPKGAIQICYYYYYYYYYWLTTVTFTFACKHIMQVTACIKIDQNSCGSYSIVSHTK